MICISSVSVLQVTLVLVFLSYGVCVLLRTSGRDPVSDERLLEANDTKYCTTTSEGWHGSRRWAAGCRESRSNGSGTSCYFTARLLRRWIGLVGDRSYNQRSKFQLVVTERLTTKAIRVHAITKPIYISVPYINTTTQQDSLFPKEISIERSPTPKTERFSTTQYHFDNTSSSSSTNLRITSITTLLYKFHNPKKQISEKSISQKEKNADVWMERWMARTRTPHTLSQLPSPSRERARTGLWKYQRETLAKVEKKV